MASKCTFVSIVGRPSAGKSTLLNTLCGAKTAITSPVPQTTRNNIRGILTKGNCQLIFIDTPGIHRSNKKLNLRLLRSAKNALADSGIILYILDAARGAGSEEDEICRLINEALLHEGTCLVTAINKYDKAQAEQMRAARLYLKEKFPALPEAEIFKISALKKTGCRALLEHLIEAAPEGEFLYDKDCYTDQHPSFRVAEIVREKIFNYLYDEVPHSVFVETSGAELKNGVLYAAVTIWTERESQKGIVIGSGGTQLKKIREAALKDLKQIFDWRVKLELSVKTKTNWRQNSTVLKKILQD